MITLLSPTFVQQPVTQADMNLASIAWGFTLGFGLLTTWTAVKQTRSIWARHGTGVFKSPYAWMIWLETIDCLIFSTICWFHLHGEIPPSFAFYFTILTLWALQVQFLLQIIINRVSILLVSRRKSFWLKTSVACIITAINISVYNIWIPARLQTSENYVHINEIWDRIEKGLYLIIDAALNWYFMRVVKKQLLGLGLSKYKPLLTFNMWIIGLSLSMDVLIISMMSLSNTFVYMQFHPLAYIVKLNIEMSMADLIAKISRPVHVCNVVNGVNSCSGGDRYPAAANKSTRRSGVFATEHTHKRQSYNDELDLHDNSVDSIGKTTDLELVEMGEGRRSIEGDGGMVVHTKREVHVTVSRTSGENNEDSGSSRSDQNNMRDSDERPLREKLATDAVDKRGRRTGPGFGSTTQIWGHQRQE